MLQKFRVTLEFDVKSVDLLDVEVEVEYRNQAIKAAEQKYLNNEIEDPNFYASNSCESTLQKGNQDVQVYKIEEEE